MSAISEAAAGANRLRRAQRFLADNPVVVLVVVLVALLVITDVVNRQQSGAPFVTWKQLSTTLLVAAPLGLIAGGQNLVMLTGGVDLSIAYIATAAAYVTAWQGGSGTASALLLGLVTGAVIGLVNGVGVAVFRVNPLIMTLGVGSVLFGLLSIYAAKAFEKTIPNVVSSLGTERFFGYLPVNVLLWAPVAAALVLGLRYMGYGRMVYAVGDNPVASRLAGVRIWQVLILVYVLCGVLAAMGGMLLLGFVGNPDLGLATPYLLPSVAAVVIGGTSILGGFGGYSGTILGVLILTVLTSLLNVLNGPEWVKQVLYGSLIIAFTAIYARASASD